MNIKLLALAVASATLLTACGAGEDGDNGRTGEAGPQGIAGAAGSDGQNGQDGADGQNGADGQDGKDGANGANGTNGANGSNALPVLTRLATTPEGAELTGMFKTDNGEMFFNIQHPSSSLPGDEGLAAVGAWVGVDLDNLDPSLTSLTVPTPGSADAQTTKVVTGSFQVLGREGETYSGDLPFGLGNIVTADGTASIKQSNDPDFNAFIPSNANGSEGYLFTAWEDRPGAMSRMQLTKGANGWTVGSVMNVDFTAVKGTMINCFGSVSPWGTPLTSEENYEAQNAENWNNSGYDGGYPDYSDVQNIQTYLGGTYPNPYDYGYIVEITDPTGAATPVKHFTMGRIAHENAVIMPDNKTVYLTDDGSYKAFYKFVADTAGDLSAGTLYVAKVKQDATADHAKAGFDIEWLTMGHSDNATIEAFIDTFDGIDEADYVAGSSNYVTDAQITAHVNGTTVIEALPFVETHRVAVEMGATAEFDKMEGININYDSAAVGTVPFMYVAMSDVRNGMADTTGDIQVEANRCGIVYRLGLHADFNVTRMEPAVVGGAYDSTLSVNQCDVNGIAQPDNVAVLDDGRVLIGEDTGRHNNNMLWIYNPKGE